MGPIGRPRKTKATDVYKQIHSTILLDDWKMLREYLAKCRISQSEFVREAVLKLLEDKGCVTTRTK